MGRNDDAWEQLFEKYHILDKIRHDGQYIITADKIREFREPRLMTKFDHRVNLPAVFRENDLSILPITRGSYAISSFKAYKEFEELSSETERVAIPSYIQSLKPQFLVSEAIALNCANACGILNDFLEDDEILPTVNGRMGAGNFQFEIDTNYGSRTIRVRNSQIEIDAAYEGIEYLSLFEAKHDLSEDFIIRQIYYPYRVWSQRIEKPVKPVFLVFSNGVFNLYQYEFTKQECYNSLVLAKQKNYVIATSITIADIEHLLKTVRVVEEPPISFPQADQFARIINLIELLQKRIMTKQDITSEYGFDERQTNYYTDAGRYLGFIEKTTNKENQKCFFLTVMGNHLFELPYRERQLAIASRILEHRVFNRVLKVHLQCGEMPDRKTIMQIMKECLPYRVEAESTYYRRASTVMGWVNWILGIVDDG